MDAIPPELWQYPALAAVVIVSVWLIKYFGSQMTAERESYANHMEADRNAFEKVASEFSASSTRILLSCESNTEKMLKFMEDQDIRWRQTMKTRDDLFFERIKGLENVIREARNGKG